jgi:hypothetical protein
MTARKAGKTLRLILDRIEDSRMAVFSVRGGGQLALPVNLCPEGLREGAAYDLAWQANPAAEQALRRDVEQLQKALLKQSKRSK